MNPTTTKLLATLEILDFPGKTFFWDATQGEFNLWNLMIHEGFVNPTDIEFVFEHWKNIETWGTPTNPIDYRYAPPRSERDDDDWNEEIENQRKNYYQQLQKLITDNAKNIEAYNLDVPVSLDSNFTFYDSDFTVSIVIGETKDNRWFCLCPIVPDQASCLDYSRAVTIDRQLATEVTQTLYSKIKAIINKLTPIQVYGYYYGAYNYIYQHRIVSAIGTTKANAIEDALQLSEMVVINKLTRKHLHNYYYNLEVVEFMNQNLQDLTDYNITFWAIAYTYEVGQTPTGDWIGYSGYDEFEYNP